MTPADINADTADNLSRKLAQTDGAEPRKIWTERGSPEARRTGIAMFFAGFASFGLIYCVQPLLPAFARDYGLSPAVSSLALSLTTTSLAISILLGAIFSQAFARREIMFASMFMGSLCNLMATMAPEWHWFLAARTLEGLMLGGVPAVAMAYLAEETAPSNLGRTMGLYVAGTAFGAMVGRIGMGIVTEYVSWAWAMRGFGIATLIGAAAFFALLPPSRNFTPVKGVRLRHHFAAWGGHMRRPVMLRLFAIGFVNTAIFVTVFNYATFRFTGEPFGLSQVQLSLIFITYGFGVVSSGVAGALCDRLGRLPVMLAGFVMMMAALLMSISGALVVAVLAMALLTMGFFVSHSATSSAVGPIAGRDTGHASSLYLGFYYLGMSTIGPLGGLAWVHGGWEAVIALCTLLGLVGLALCASMRGPLAALRLR